MNVSPPPNVASGWLKMEFCLSAQLRQKSGERRTARLVDAARGDQLVDELLNILSSEPRQRQRRCRNVVQVESVGNVHSDVARELVI